MNIIIFGPPGAGKTTLLKQTLVAWAYKNPTPRGLVVTFNKNNADVLRREIGSQSVDVSTMDGLCAKPAGTAVDFDATCSDYTVLNRYCAAEVDRKKKGRYAMVNKLKHGGGQGCAGLLTHRLKHPHAEFALCAKHKKLGWDLEFDTYPLRDMIDHASTFESRRYLCDRDKLLRKGLSKYDVVIVDEMQDLLSAQEQRLLGRHLKLRLARGPPEVEERVHDGGVLAAEADEEQQRRDAPNLVPEKRRALDADVAQRRGAKENRGRVGGGERGGVGGTQRPIKRCFVFLFKETINGAGVVRVFGGGGGVAGA